MQLFAKRYTWQNKSRRSYLDINIYYEIKLNRYSLRPDKQGYLAFKKSPRKQGHEPSKKIPNYKSEQTLPFPPLSLSTTESYLLAFSTTPKFLDHARTLTQALPSPSLSDAPPRRLPRPRAVAPAAVTMEEDKSRDEDPPTREELRRAELWRRSQRESFV
jgi:hypothetical protein